MFAEKVNRKIMLTAGEMSQQLKTTKCSFRGPRFNTQHPQNIVSQLSVTPVPDILTSLLASIDNRHASVSVIHTDKTHTHGGV